MKNGDVINPHYNEKGTLNRMINDYIFFQLHGKRVEVDVPNICLYNSQNSKLQDFLVKNVGVRISSDKRDTVVKGCPYSYVYVVEDIDTLLAWRMSR